MPNDVKKGIIYRCIVIAFAITYTLSVQAYDFQNDGLFYDIISEAERTVAVVSAPNNKLYTGSFLIPGSVTQNVTGISYKVIAIVDNAFEQCSVISVTIPETVTSIGRSAFSDCTQLKSVTILGSVTSIGRSAFSGCTQLESVTISEGVTTIGNNAFSDTGLTSVTIPGSVTSIGSSAFSHCLRLTSVTISEGVASIGDNAFSDTGLISVTIPGSVTSIGDGAFSDTRLTSVMIPGSVTTIGDNAFSDIGLTSVTISEGVTTIGNNAFSNNTRLTSVTIPESVTSIGDDAFYGCSQLYEFICKPTNAPQCTGSPFSLISQWCKLYVPKGSTGYDAWSPYFAEIIEVDFGGIDVPQKGSETIRIVGRNLMVENVALQGNISIYNPNGQLIRSVIPDPSSKQICIEGLDKGMYFVVLQSAGALTTHKIIVP